MGPVSKSAKKAKTPGPDVKKKNALLKRKALSEGAPVIKGKLSSKFNTKDGKAKTPKKSKAADEENVEMIQKTPAGGKKTPKKTPKQTPKPSGKNKPSSVETKTPKGTAKEAKSDSDEENTKIIQKTPAGGKGKKTPKSSGKSKSDSVEAKTPKDTPNGVMSEGKKALKASGKKAFDKVKKSAVQTPKVKNPKQKSMSEEANLKKAISIKEPASTGGKTKKTKKQEDVKLPFDIEDDYDEEEDDDFDMDDDDDDDDSEASESGESDSDGEFDDDDDDDDGVLDDDDEDEDYNEEDEDDESSSSYSDDSEISLESNESDEEITFNPPAKKKGTESPKKQTKQKADKTPEMTKILPKPTKTPKGTKDNAETSGDTKKSSKTSSKTPKSALKPPGKATSTDKKVSLAVTPPEREKSSKKVVSTPHPSLTKKRRPEDDDEKENHDENSVTTTSKKDKTGKGNEEDEPLQKQLSFGDEEEEEDKKSHQAGKVKVGKRKLDKEEDESDEDEPVDLSPDGIYYHCGNLPPTVSKEMVEWFFAEADVELDRIILKREKVVHTETTAIKKSKAKYRKKTTKVHHCYAILKCKTKEDATKLDSLNGTEFTAPDGKWRTYNLTIFPMLARKQGPKGIMKDDNCVHIRPLNHKTIDEELQQFFKENGVEPVNVRIARRGARQISKGYAFAWFRSPTDVVKAMKLSGKELQEFKLNITKAKSKVQGIKKYNYQIGSNLEIKQREGAQAEVKKKQKKKVKTM